MPFCGAVALLWWKGKAMNKLGEYLRDNRVKQGLTLGQLARMVGYRNINKGERRITALERTGKGKADLLVNVASALNLDWEMVLDLAEEDQPGAPAGVGAVG